MGYQHKGQRTGTTLYSEVTDRIIAQLEEGVLPWVKPWDDGRAPLGLPRNGQTGRCYSGINVLILWHTLFHRRFHSQRWVTFRALKLEDKNPHVACPQANKSSF